MNLISGWPKKSSKSVYTGIGPRGLVTRCRNKI